MRNRFLSTSDLRIQMFKVLYIEIILNWNNWGKRNLLLNRIKRRIFPYFFILTVIVFGEFNFSRFCIIHTHPLGRLFTPSLHSLYIIQVVLPGDPPSLCLNLFSRFPQGSSILRTRPALWISAHIDLGFAVTRDSKAYRAKANMLSVTIGASRINTSNPKWSAFLSFYRCQGT